MFLNVFGLPTWSLEVFLSPLTPCRSTASSDLLLFISTTMSSLLAFSLVLRRHTVRASYNRPHTTFLIWNRLYMITCWIRVCIFYAFFRSNKLSSSFKTKKTYRSCFPERPHAILPFLYMKYSTLPRMASSRMKMMMIAMMYPFPPGGSNKKVQTAFTSFL